MITSNILVDNVTTDLRIAGRIVQETMGGVRRTGWMNLIIIITMASILTIFGTLFFFLIETQLFVQTVGSGLKISVYAPENTDLDAMKQEIEKLDNVKNISLVSRDKAWEDMKKHYQVPDIGNPLPHTFHIGVKDPEKIKPTVDALEKIPGVEKVGFAQRVLDKVQRIAQITSAVGLAVSIFFGMLTLFIISNTIHLLIEARGREIEILRMMGVGNWYIRLPFLIQGAMYGFIGAFIALFPLSVAQNYLNQFFQLFEFSTSSYSHNFVFTVLVLMGVVVGAGGASVSIHKYLKI